MNNYKKGDITKNGWEVVDVILTPQYKMRKRITINNQTSKYNGEKGWWYIYNKFNWVELDDYPNKQLRFKESELNY